MREKHMFLGTKTMYKKRLNAWNLVKNLSLIDTPEILQETEKSSTAQENMFVIRGKRVDSQKVARYLKLKVEQNMTSTSKKSETPASPNVSHATYGLSQSRNSRDINDLLSLKPAWLTSPEAMRIPEDIISISHQFIDSSIDSSADGLRVLTLPLNETFIWSTRVYYARSLVLQRQSKHGFMLLDKSCEELKGLILTPDPAIPILMLPARHPMRLIWAELSHIGPSQTRNDASLNLCSYLSFLERKFGANDQAIFLFTSLVYDRMNSVGLLSLDASEMIYRRIAGQLQSSGNTMETLYCNLGLALAYRRCKQHRKAETIMDGLRLQARTMRGEIKEDIDQNILALS
ncbi:uncharacterized protein JN550_013852 [Neoarthrinium moseri]|uniref:uncharacterized protein n=1 Tax=Neoarthrinium moseri TaxID=1658444 RepID=UPI001FDE6D9D|nr:uncharacterized protein JN550_013852 [Neoarthrinium moseri]KAI1856321.1 hypothetical protein JN550_013852 [Neoarthrinium moseri]